MYTIYKITNIINNKIYIGLTKDTIENRLRGHIRHSRTGKSNQRLHQAMAKHGAEFFSIVALTTCEDIESACNKEIDFIKESNSKEYKIGYNMTDGGWARDGQSDSTKSKISASVQAHRDSLSEEDKKALTAKANAARRGSVESDAIREIRSSANKKRWENLDSAGKSELVSKMRAGMSEEGKERSIKALTNAFSPARMKGVKKSRVVCPHCGKEGGGPVMKRFHFSNCKDKT